MTTAPPACRPGARARAVWASFLLRDAERLSEACASSTRDEVRALARAASERAAVAERLREGHVGSALSLYREAAIFYMASFVASRTGEAPPEPLRGDEVLARFRALVPDEALAGAPAPRAAFLDGVRVSDARAVERLAPSEAVAAGQTASAVVLSLAALVEPRPVADIVFLRRVRLVGLGLAAFVLVVWLTVDLLGRRTNLALHKPVTTSGVHPSATSPPSGLTDGVTIGTYGVHTAVSATPWVMVDLLGVHVVDTVKVYNRGDGYYNDGLPMTVQVFEDGISFRDVGTRTTTFGQERPWTVEVPRRKARYVRVRGGAGKYVALSELEVFGVRP